MRTRRARTVSPPGFAGPAAAETTTEAPGQPPPPERPRTDAKPAPTTPRGRTSDGDIPDLRNARTHSVFARTPEPLPRWLEVVVTELRAERPKATRQDVIAALMLRYVRPGDPRCLAHLHELLDELDHARGLR